MSSPSELGTSLFRLPEGREVEVVLVKLADGRIVGRTRDELELLESAEKGAAGDRQG